MLCGAAIPGLEKSQEYVCVYCHRGLKAALGILSLRLLHCTLVNRMSQSSMHITSLCGSTKSLVLRFFLCA